jgi:hypothetical protein
MRKPSGIGLQFRKASCDFVGAQEDPLMILFHSRKGSLDFISDRKSLLGFLCCLSNDCYFDLERAPQ